MRYCKKCIMPDTKPDLTFDEEGICNACRSSERKYAQHKDPIDWNARKKEFEALIKKFKNDDPLTYDCIIPVSGGKDSMFLVYALKEVYKMRPLCVLFEPTLPTKTGRKNIDVMNRMGVDLIHFKRNPLVYDYMVKEGLRRVGDNDWPNHIGIFTVPIHFAVKFNVPLVIWGECPQTEYGGYTKEARSAHVLDQRWLYDYGGLIGNRPEDMVCEDLNITLSDLKPYIYPSKEDLERVGVTSVWYGYYFPWNVPEQLRIVKERGWVSRIDRVEVTYEDYENIDCYSMTIHDYLKFVKYGFGRATDDLVRDIRNGIIDREEAVRLADRYEGKYPLEAARRFCRRFGYTREEFDEICDSFTNRVLFETEKDGTFKRDIDGSLILKKKYVEMRRDPTKSTKRK
ncbi:MAG: N-acetyl sugar amidotransferase [Candidatus Woesearchaeota archaeon]|nr:MAG: N-acetyl sugar amidotransferase [Candidatus Woesearchaeota archaeon]